MPLRSVEAATRDDAIAAAREQFGLSARVVGVRRVRSGGVLGFFATERYVAEVDPDPGARPAVPVPAPSTGERRAVQDPVRESARESARDAAREWAMGTSDGVAARRGVPARNAAAAWAAEARVAPARPEVPARPAVDDDRVDELAGLLTGAPEPVPYAPAPFTRPTRTPEPQPRPAVVRTPAVRPAWSELLAGSSSTPAPAAAPAAVPVTALADAEPSAGPSPFTAALARMVAGDRDVEQAVEDALTGPAEERTPGTPAPPPTWSGPTSAAETSVRPLAAHQEEEPVELQDWTPSLPPVVDVPETWTPVLQPAPGASPATREESIAEVLRAALAEGRSDEALAGILRKVMDGASPAVALADPPAQTPVLHPVHVEQVAVEPVAVEPVLVEPVLVEPVAVEPVAEPVHVDPVAVEPVTVEAVVATSTPERVPDAVCPEPATAPEPVTAQVEQPAELFPAEAVEQAPLGAPPATPGPGGSDLGWDDPVSSSLWAETVVPAIRAAATVEEPVADVAAVEETSVADVAVEEVAEVVEDLAAIEAVAVEDTAVEQEAELSGLLAPVLARTASDPAPLSLDATTVMPPLSLLPPLPSRQRGGRPPVPPSTGRASASAAAGRPLTEPPAATEPPATSRFEALATVTRLPLGPVAEPDAPVEAPAAPVAEEPTAPVPAAAEPVPAAVALPNAAAPEPREADTAVLPAVTAPRPLPDRPRAAAPAGPAAAVASGPRSERASRPAEPVRRPAGIAQGGILDRLAALGLAEELLDSAFTADLAAQGTYAALTRMLATRLPEAPGVPAGAGDVLVVVGPGVETLRAARALAASLRLDPDRVQWATRGELAGLAPAGSRMTTIDSAIERRHEAVGSGTLTIVAVDAPLRTDAYWTAQMLAIWSPVAVWAVVEATRKPEDLGPWLEGLPRVDALVVQDTDLSADPAAVLDRVALPLGLPVAVVDGVRATPHRWASLLCERLETPQG